MPNIDRSVWILYRNHRGEVAWRHVLPLDKLTFMSTIWHQERQWIMEAIDLDKGLDELGSMVYRSFAMRDILEWDTTKPEAVT
jgi:hypothetical protein